MLLCISAPFYVLFVFIDLFSVFWLFWLSSQYLSSDWLERLLRGSLSVVRGSSPQNPRQKSVYDFLVYCIVSLFNCMICLSGPLALRDIFHAPVA